MKYTVCLLFNKKRNKVLLLLKNKTDYAGKWNGVGGKLEKHETPKMCALREIKEETGVNECDLEQFTWLGDMHLPYDCGCDAETCSLSFWAGIVKKSSVSQQSGETEKLRWFPIEDILQKKIDDEYLAGDGNLLYFINWAKKLVLDNKEETL